MKKLVTVAIFTTFIGTNGLMAFERAYYQDNNFVQVKSSIKYHKKQIRKNQSKIDILIEELERLQKENIKHYKAINSLTKKPKSRKIHSHYDY